MPRAEPGTETSAYYWNMQQRLKLEFNVLGPFYPNGTSYKDVLGILAFSTKGFGVLARKDNTGRNS